MSFRSLALFAFSAAVLLSAPSYAAYVCGTYDRDVSPQLRGYLACRVGPSVSYAELERIPENGDVEILDRRGQWFLVNNPATGHECFVFSRFVCD